MSLLFLIPPGFSVGYFFGYLSGSPGALGYSLVYSPLLARAAVYFSVYFSVYFPAVPKTYFLGTCGCIFDFPGSHGAVVGSPTSQAVCQAEGGCSKQSTGRRRQGSETKRARAAVTRPVDPGPAPARSKAEGGEREFSCWLEFANM